MMKDLKKISLVAVFLSALSISVNAEIVVEDMDFQNTFKAVNLAPGTQSGDAVNFEQALKETSAILSWNGNWVKDFYPTRQPVVVRIGNICELNALSYVNGYISTGTNLMNIPKGFAPVGKTRSGVEIIRRTDGGNTLETFFVGYNNGGIRNNRVIQADGDKLPFKLHWTYVCQ